MNGRLRKASEPLRVVELFAGVGGFRLGLCGANGKRKGYRVVWANQWEPATTVQHAARVYRERFHGGTEPNIDFNTDIFKVVDAKKLDVPRHDLLVGGFPCQDYSVARTLSHAAGIDGKKGVLWWAIHGILKRLGKDAPPYLMLENVDRLANSPASKRGRDFSIMLATLADLGYAVEWRIINAGDYGMPQRRRRIFIIGYRKGSPIWNQLITRGLAADWLRTEGVTASAFPVENTRDEVALPRIIEGDAAFITTHSPQREIAKAGLMINRAYITFDARPRYAGKRTTLGDVLLASDQVNPEYLVPESQLARWTYLKGAKNEHRAAKTGFTYSYKEGPVAFPDPLDKPSRTVITGEGGPTPARHKHVVTQDGKLRRLMPIELERLCMFPDDHTKLEGIGDQRRAFFMGNALVVGVIDRLGKALLAAHRRAQGQSAKRLSPRRA